MKGLFIGTGYRHADNVKNNAKQHDKEQNPEGHGKRAAGHDLIGDQADEAGNH